MRPRHALCLAELLPGRSCARRAGRSPALGGKPLVVPGLYEVSTLVIMPGHRRVSASDPLAQDPFEFWGAVWDPPPHRRLHRAKCYYYTNGTMI